MSLKEKVSIVTGGSMGIGRGIAFELAQKGATVVVADVSVEEGKAVVEELMKLGSKALFVETDTSSEESVKNMVSKVMETYGQIDVLATAAGIIRAGKIVDIAVEAWDTIMSVNLRGVFLSCKYVGREMIKRKSGKIVNISSVAGRNAERGNVPYCATKSGVISLTQGMALEMAEYGINVNVVCPGATDTRIMTAVFDDRGPVLGMTSDELRKKFEDGLPLGRMARPSEIGQAVVFLASDDSAYITGQCVVVDGGLELTRPGL